MSRLRHACSTAKCSTPTPPELLRRAPNTLRWYCCSNAGVDLYCADPTLFANPDCMLTNSNAYGVTISEHVIMVTLMLLRRMPEYEQFFQRRSWPSPLPIRSIRDGSFTLLGTGNIGSHVAERLRGMGAARILGLVVPGGRSPALTRYCPSPGWTRRGPEAHVLILSLPSTPET
ncbi:MAG: NAD(P)-dependent oxidoreductase [Oscillospiraceae bacterium]